MSAQLPPQDLLNIHASCVALNDRAVLITGASGSGKSSLALQLMALGARLVSDDRTDLHVQGQRLIASAPASIAGLVEARGVGILSATACAYADVVVVIDMDKVETQRLPTVHSVTICNIQRPCLYKIEAPHFPAAVVQYLKSNRRDPS